MKIFCLAALAALLAGCPDLSTICPHKPITQGVFGEVVNASGAIEEDVTVEIYTMLNGVMGTKFGTTQTTRGGYQFIADASSYFVCAKTVCSPVTVPTGVVELSAIDAAGVLTWEPQVAVPPKQTIGPCTFGE